MRGGVGLIARVGVLGAWTSLFIWLLISGEVVRFIGPRTRWVVVMGAFVLAIVTVSHIVAWARLATARRRLDLRGLAALLVPVALAVAVPGAGLGAAAAARKSAPGTPVFAPTTSGVVSFPEIEYAAQSSDYAAEVGAVEGRDVVLTGFVTHPEGLPPGWFALTRFAMFCCAADAIPYSVTIDPGSRADSFPEDTWLEVSGTLAQGDEALHVRADRIKEVAVPADPHL